MIARGSGGMAAPLQRHAPHRPQRMLLLTDVTVRYLARATDEMARRGWPFCSTTLPRTVT